jgi:hypothetical protein
MGDTLLIAAPCFIQQKINIHNVSSPASKLCEKHGSLLTYLIEIRAVSSVEEL